MEDALVLQPLLLSAKKGTCLNPCFNGRCTSTSGNQIPWMKLYCCLNPCFNGRCTSTEIIEQLLKHGGKRLNPCFNGRCTSTAKLR